MILRDKTIIFGGLWCGLILGIIALVYPPERPQAKTNFAVLHPATTTVIGAQHAEPPPGCEIEEHVQPNGTFYTLKIGNFSMAPYALYDTRQGAVNFAWTCYRPTN